MKKIILILSLSIFHCALAAKIIPDYNMSVYDKTIEQIYQTLQTENTTQRIEQISRHFLGKPYQLGSLGEGKNAKFDQDPIYRTDTFDCLTYVSTVIALAKANNLPQFQEEMNKIQYRHAKPSFFNRLHFMSVDWNVVNAQNGIIQDITYRFKDANGRALYKTAQALINKPAWYRKMTSENLVLIHPLSVKEEEKRLQALRSLSRKAQKTMGSVRYIPLTALFYTNGKPNQTLFNQIPSGAIIEIVRPNWDLEKLIGTRLNISHVGFAIRTPQDLMFREASSLEHQVIDTSLAEYLKNYLNSPTVKGINIHIVL